MSGLTIPSHESATPPHSRLSDPFDVLGLMTNLLNSMSSLTPHMQSFSEAVIGFELSMNHSGELDRHPGLISDVSCVPLFLRITQPTQK